MAQTPKKLLFVITKSNWGGAQRYVYNLATNLPREEFDVSVALGGTGQPGSAPGELAQKLAVANIPTHTVSAFAREVLLWSDARALVELVRIFRREQPDMVHLNSSKAGGVGALAARLVGVKKIIFTSHGLAWDEDRGPLARRAIMFFTWMTFLLCHRVIVISQDNFARATALRWCGKKVYLVHNGLPTLQFETRERARLSLALLVGLTEDSGMLWIGTIAELTRNKGLPYLIGAAKLLLDAGKKFHLFIIGSGEEEEQLKALVTENNLDQCIHFVGFVSDAYRYDKAFDLFALASVKEGLPTVLIEAGQAGATVVASNIPGTIDIIADGKTGLLFPTKDAESLAAQLATLLDNPPLREQLSRALQEKVTREFSIERMVEETRTIYRS